MFYQPSKFNCVSKLYQATRENEGPLIFSCRQVIKISRHTFFSNIKRSTIERRQRMMVIWGIPIDYQGKRVIPKWSSTEVIPLKLFLSIVPSSSAIITRLWCGCFREGFLDIYVVSFPFVSKERKTPAKLSVCFNTLQIFN